MARFPLAQRFTHRKLHHFDYEYELRRELAELYPDVDDLREATIQELWEIARDLTVAIDRLARKNQPEDGPLTGPEKMEIAVDVIRSFIGPRGGAKAVREAVARNPISRFGRIRRWITRTLLTPDSIEGAIRFVLELAVAELKTARKGGT